SPYHLEAVASHIIGLDGELPPILAVCKKREMCAGDLSDIEIEGINIDKIKVKGFKCVRHPAWHDRINRGSSFSRYMKEKLFRPYPKFLHARCTSCGICVDHCPAKTIAFVDKLPVVNLDKCIRCFCCQELCPSRAIAARTPLLMRLIRNL
ncbi:MAG: 4Fe-4S binding protein, partial [Oligoflexales bacterium]|nr:4Fe-4S binding protein [Oligoflexales bacterium]